MSDDELEDLEDVDPRYLFAIDYLARYEIGLAPPREELTAYEEQVILFVASERHAQRREMKADAPTPERQAFEEEAEPEEVEMSDDELMAAARGRRHAGH